MGQEIPAEYRQLITDTFAGDVQTANSKYPETQSVRLDWEEIRDANETIADALLRNPKSTRETLTEAVKQWDEVDMPDVIVRIHNIPDENSYRVGKQRTRHLGTVIRINGEVAEIDAVKPLAEVAAFECRRCGTITRVPQGYGPLMRPSECMGCEKSGSKKDYLFRREQSELIDVREVILKRQDTNLDDDPPILKLRLTGDLVERLGPGDTVSLVGHYDSGVFQSKSILSTYLDVWAIENHEEGVLTDDIPPEKIQGMIVDEVSALQDEDPNDFGADRTEVLDAIEAQGVRRKEVESNVEELIDDGPVDDIAGDKLLVSGRT